MLQGKILQKNSKKLYKKRSYVSSLAIKRFGGSPTIVAAPPMFENIQIAIRKRTGFIAGEKYRKFLCII